MCSLLKISYFLILIALGVCLDLETLQTETTLEQVNECSEKLSMNISAFEPGTEKAMCFIKCILEKREIIDNDGVFQVKNLDTLKLPAHIHFAQTFIDCVKTVRILECKDVKQIQECTAA